MQSDSHLLTVCVSPGIEDPWYQRLRLITLSLAPRTFWQGLPMYLINE